MKKPAKSRLTPQTIIRLHMEQFIKSVSNLKALHKLQDRY